MLERQISSGDLSSVKARIAALPEYVRRCSKCGVEVTVGSEYDVRIADGGPPFDRNLIGCSPEMVNGAAAYADIILTAKTFGESDCVVA
jgi:hypothetical protein